MPIATATRCPARAIQIDRSVGDLWTEFAAIIPAAHSYEDVRNPKYFGAQRTRDPRSPRPVDDGIRIGDIIRCRAQDFSWQAELSVRDIPAGMDEVHTAEVRFISFAAEDVPEGFQLKFFSEVRGWIIMLNGEVIDEGFRTPELAAKEIKKLENSRTIVEKMAKASEKGAKEKAAKAKAEKAPPAEVKAD